MNILCDDAAHGKCAIESSVVKNQNPTRRGRPPKSESERRGRNITFRTPGGLRSRLEESAKIAGRSLSEEVVFRLERSFLEQGRRKEHLFGEWRS